MKRTPVGTLVVCLFLCMSANAQGKKDPGPTLGRLTIDDSFPDGQGPLELGARSDGNATYLDQRLGATENPCVTITINQTGQLWADLDETPSANGTGYDCVTNTNINPARAFKVTLPNPGPGHDRSPCKILCTDDQNCTDATGGLFEVTTDQSCTLTLMSVPGLPNRNVNPRLQVGGLFGKRSPAATLGLLFRIYENAQYKGSYTITTTDRLNFTIPGGNNNLREVKYQGSGVVTVVDGKDSGTVSDPFPFHIKFTAEQNP